MQLKVFVLKVLEILYISVFFFPYNIFKDQFPPGCLKTELFSERIIKFTFSYLKILQGIKMVYYISYVFFKQCYW